MSYVQNFANLFRLSTSDEGTFGEIYFMDKKLFTLELPYRDVDGDGKSDNGFSCIEKGTYPADWVLSPKRQRNIYQLKDTGHRLAVQIHSGNFGGDILKDWDSQIEGCILLGKSIGELLNSKGKMQKAILDSKAALAEFELAMDHEPFTLMIHENFGAKSA